MAAPCLAAHKQSYCPARSGRRDMGSYSTTDILRVSAGFETKMHSERLYFLLPKVRNVLDLSFTNSLVSLHPAPAVTQSAARQLPKLMQRFGLVSWKCPMENSIIWKHNLNQVGWC